MIIESFKSSELTTTMAARNTLDVIKTFYKKRSKQ